MKMPEPMTAPIPSAVRDQGPRVFCRRCPGVSDSAISLSIDLQQRSWFAEVRTTCLDGGSDVVGCDKGFDSPGTEEFVVSAQQAGSPTPRDFRRVGIPMRRPTPDAAFYRFAWPRAIFLTFGFFDPRGYSRGFNGLSALRFLRAVRFAFLRSSLLNFVVFAMNGCIRPFSLQIVFLALRPYNSKSFRTERIGRAIPSTRCRRSRTPGRLHWSATCAPLAPR